MTNTSFKSFMEELGCDSVTRVSKPLNSIPSSTEARHGAVSCQQQGGGATRIRIKLIPRANLSQTNR